MRPTLITIIGQFQKLDGTPEVGILTFQSPVMVLYSLQSQALVPSRKTVTLDETGSFEIEVPATNDPAWIPQGWKYRLTIRLSEDYETYDVSVPYNATNHILALAQLIPVDNNLPVTSTNYAPIIHSHAASDIVSGTINMDRLPVGTTHDTVSIGDHTHPGIGANLNIGSVTGLQSALDSKANSLHSHAITDVTGLQTALNAKANTTDVTTGLANKANTSSLSVVATSGSYNDLLDRPAGTGTSPVSSVAGKTGDVTLTKSDVGLTNVDNTADAAKPISSATQSALDAKAPIASPTFTGTVSGITKSMVGLANVDNTSDVNKPVSSATQTALNAKANTSSLATVATSGSYTDLTNKPTIPTIPVTSVASRTGDVVLAKTDVGLANVDNTSDANKPVSSATQTALNAKANTSSLAAVATSGSYADLSNKPIQVWNGSAYAVSSTAQIYIGPNDPGTVPDGSVWIQVP